MAELFWLNDAQWAAIEPLLPKLGGKPRVDDRRVLSGILHRFRDGLAVARTSGGLWAADHGVQPVQPLEPAWPLAGDFCRPCRLRGSAAHRHGGQHLGLGTSRGRGR